MSNERFKLISFKSLHTSKFSWLISCFFKLNENLEGETKKMGNLNRYFAEISSDFYVSFASICLIISMIFTLLGIKFRWFKHRMVFEQIPDNNVPNGTLNSIESKTSRKMSKPSQQFREPVIIHGVFRKRQEDDVEYERPKSLPPIRIRKSSNVPPVLLPPRRRSQVNSEILTNLPVPSTSISSSESNSPDVIDKNASIEYEMKSIANLDHNDHSPNTTRNEPIYAESTKRYKPKKSSIRDKSKASPHNKEINERRPTGFVHLTDSELKELELSSAVAINEIDLIKLNWNEEEEEENDINKLQFENEVSTAPIKPIERKITFYDENSEDDNKCFQHPKQLQLDNVSMELEVETVFPNPRTLREMKKADVQSRGSKYDEIFSETDGGQTRVTMA